jgi:hypothetical protein
MTRPERQQTVLDILKDFRGPERLRTASERIALLDLESVGADLFALSPLAIQKRHDEAFNKEPLTKDFFKRFDQALEAIKGDLEEYQKPFKPAEAYTQAQLLLERLIFLYFLQNRGWLNQDRSFLLDHLTEHLPKPGVFSYYGEFLDKLFWTLSSAPGEGGRLPGIPFLNGGLFDDDEFRQPAGLRKTNPPLKVRNSTFKSVFGDLLEAFNFTVTEDTPLNQEVAVDPEMLGKVFESIVLHAEAADPDATAPDKRKATGSYYTPRIVVHFICREVLYQYLHARVVAPGFSPADADLKVGATEAGAALPISSGQALGGAAKDDWAARLRALLDMDASDGLDDEAKERLKCTITPAQAVQLRDLVLPLKCCDPAVGSGAFPVGLLHELVNLRRLLTTAAKAEANGEPVPAPPAGRSAARQGPVGAGLLVPAFGEDTHVGCPYAFLKAFKRIIDDETVPEDIPFAVPYEELENRKIKISPKVKSIRGKLNVPRERFHLRARTTYLWAGL